MPRGCDLDICQLPAVWIGTFTTPQRENQTRAACGQAHKDELTQDFKMRKMPLTWEPVAKPKEAAHG